MGIDANHPRRTIVDGGKDHQAIIGQVQSRRRGDHPGAPHLPGPFWWPQASAETRGELERIHTEGCRVINGAVSSVRVADVIREAGFRSLSHIILEQAIRVSTRASARHQPPDWCTNQRINDQFTQRTVMQAVAPSVAEEELGDGA